jgi:kinetochore protein NDC80
MIVQMDSLDHEIRNHVSSCTAEARRMKDESEKKENQMSTVEKDADELLKVLSCFVFLKFILLR